MNAQRFSTLLLILLASALSGAAQGAFSMANAAATAITNLSTGGQGTRATGLKVGMYFTTNLSATNFSDSHLFVPNPGAVTNLFTPGLFVGGARTVPGVPPGGYVVAQIRAWDSNYATFEEAGGSLRCRMDILKGMSQPFLLGPLGGPEQGPAIPITGSNKRAPSP